jgi:hypothetical protein
MANLMDGLIEQCNRCRELVAEYQGLPNGVGTIGAMLIEHDIKVAERAMGSGDVVQMLAAYETLKGCE